MQTISQSINISIHEIGPAEFAPLCSEAHAANRGKLAEYLHKLVEENRGALFAAFDPNGHYAGRVCVEIDPTYVTRGKSCATFGWLDGIDPDVIKVLLDQASAWAAIQKVDVEGTSRRNSLLRGPISSPKKIGGIGCQVEGFPLPRMYGIPANRPELAGWIECAGFKQDAGYACVDVTTTPKWESAGTDFAQSFRLVNFTPSEWEARRDEIVGLVARALSELLPDTVAGRFEEVVGTMRTHPEGKYYWSAALDSEGKLAGVIVCIPNLYQAWDGQPVTGVNTDTVVIHPKYRGRGLFSALHDKGMADMRAHCGITYWEGTAIWMANENAVKTIFPHGTIVRKHVVFQKRLKRSAGNNTLIGRLDDDGEGVKTRREEEKII